MPEADRPPADPDALFARFRACGDAGALASLFDATAPDLYRLALTLAPDPATAEDAVQEAFLAAIEHSDRFDPARPVLPWLVGVLRHKVEDLRRRGSRRPDPWRLPVPVEDDEPPLTEAARREREERVRAALEGLPDALRVPALLRWRHGLEPADIAHLLRPRPGRVRMALSRALERLRPRLGSLAGVALAGGPRPTRGLDAVR
ncbi:MAG TPA: sigma-70 family RNA polymerase sigma factor, partial [Planctomycetota bacterium]|nr:sigma-70 family RNA polymerase sigma factor [Planctomycetota bacterium]